MKYLKFQKNKCYVYLITTYTYRVKIRKYINYKSSRTITSNRVELQDNWNFHRLESISRLLHRFTKKYSIKRLSIPLLTVFPIKPKVLYTQVRHYYHPKHSLMFELCIVLIIDLFRFSSNHGSTHILLVMICIIYFVQFEIMFFCLLLLT